MIVDVDDEQICCWRLDRIIIIIAYCCYNFIVG
jgi:hypothetical protein